jgi:hypothetical protein
VRDGAPQTLTKLFVFGSESSYNILPTNFDFVCKNYRVHMCTPMSYAGSAPVWLMLWNASVYFWSIVLLQLLLHWNGLQVYCATCGHLQNALYIACLSGHAFGYSLVKLTSICPAVVFCIWLVTPNYFLSPKMARMEQRSKSVFIAYLLYDELPMSVFLFLVNFFLALDSTCLSPQSYQFFWLPVMFGILQSIEVLE